MLQPNGPRGRGVEKGHDEFSVIAVRPTIDGKTGDSPR